MAWDQSLPGLLAVNIVMVVLGVVTTALRFWSRAVIVKGRYGLDDWLCLAALFPIIALGCVGMYMTRNGLSSDMAHMPGPQQSHIFKGFFACWMLFSLGLGLTKLSTLAFYKRVFGQLRQHDLLSWTIPFCMTLFVTVGWLILAIFFIIFRCRPVSRAWNLSEPGRCFSPISTYLLFLSVVNLFEDIMLILLPIPRIMKLALRPRKKMLITTLLVFGASIPLICIGRVVTIVFLKTNLDTQFPRFIIPIGFWIVAEPSISLLAISLPALFQLVQLGRKHGIKSLLTGRDRPLHTRKTFYQGHLRPSIELVRNEAGLMTSSVQVETGTSMKVSSSSPNSDRVLLDDIIDPLAAPEAIHVKREFKVRYDDSSVSPD